MCTYPISLEESLVVEAENTLQISESFQTWLQKEIEAWLLAQINMHQAKPRREKLSDEMLAEKLKDFPPLNPEDFPELDTQDYSAFQRNRSGKLTKGLENFM